MSAADALGDAIDRSLETAPVLDKGGYGYLIHPLTDGVPRVEPQLLAAWSHWASKQRDILDGATLLVAPEAMALPLAAMMGQAENLPYVVVRKRAYGLPGERTVRAETGYGGSTLHLNDVTAADRVVVIDDVLSTGGTLESVLASVTEVGARVQGVLVFLEKEGAARQRLVEHFGVQVRAMRRASVEDGRVRVLTDQD